MLDEAFSHTIADQTKRACQRPIDDVLLGLYLEQRSSLFHERGVRLEVAERILQNAFGREQYQDASVRIPAVVLAQLSEAELTELKESFSGAVRGAFEVLGEQIPHAYLGAIDSTSPTNILEHERDHLKPIPEAVVARGWVEIVFYRDSGRRELDAVCNLPVDEVQLTDRQEALSASEPKSLCPHDIKDAVAAALRTRDQEFIATIGKRIQERGRHE